MILIHIDGKHNQNQANKSTILRGFQFSICTFATPVNKKVCGTRAGKVMSMYQNAESRVAKQPQILLAMLYHFEVLPGKDSAKNILKNMPNTHDFRIFSIKNYCL